MGVGLSEYRAAIGRYAAIASVKAWLEKKQKWRLPKSHKKKKNEQKLLPKINKSASLARWRRRSISRGSERQSRSLSFQSRRKANLSVRRRSRSSFKRGRRSANNAAKRPKDACFQCKTDWLSREWQRGRRKKRDKETKQKPCCTEEAQSRARNIHFLICSTAVGCVTIEYALTSVVQMLLIRSGIETNPGPTCSSVKACSVSQHFNRVKNSIETAEKDFQSKRTPTTLSEKNIEIVETGIYHTILSSFLVNNNNLFRWADFKVVN